MTSNAFKSIFKASLLISPKSDDDDRDLLKNDWNENQELVIRLNPEAFQKIEFKLLDEKESELIGEHARHSSWQDTWTINHQFFRNRG